MKAKYGDIIYIKEAYYRHYGIYINEENVIHYDGKKDDFWLRKMQIRQTNMNRFLGSNNKYHVCRGRGKYDEIQTVKRAKSRIGEEKFDLVYNNCEHFSRWCKSGHHRSNQVNYVCLLVLTLLYKSC